MILADAWKGFWKIGWFLPGFILYAAFPPMCETADILFALAPIIWLSRQGDAKKSATCWFQSGIFFWVATLSWMPAITKNGGPWPLVVLGWGALAVYCAAYFAAYGYLSAKYWQWARLRRGGRIFGILLVEPILWCGLELVRSRLGGGFAWNQLGVVPVNVGFGAPAALGGVYLCSAVVFLINGSIAGIAERIIANIRMRWRKSFDASALSPLRTIETLLVFVVIWLIYSLSSASVFNPPAFPATCPQAKPLNVALVQRNFPCCFKAQAENPLEVYSNLFQNVALLKPDLVVLPESAMSEFGLLDAGAIRFVQTMQPLLGNAAILAGGTRIDRMNGAEERIFNSAGLYWLTKEGYVGLELMDKVHLVPFGEFIPGDKLFPALKKLAPVGSCTSGEPHLLRLSHPSTSFGVAICFEDTDSALMREYARRGAKFLCFITNDSWFSHSDEALAHAWQATARAIETGLPVVRVGNSGVTGTITATGKASWLLGADGKPLVDRAGTMCDHIPIFVLEPLDGIRTPYVRYGDYPLGILFTLLISYMVMVKYRNYVHEKRRRMSLQVG